jgi:hypothetical protein
MAKEGFVGPGQGLGAGYVNFEPVRFVDERPTVWINPQEVDRRGHTRDSGVSNKRSGQTGGNTDVGGR